MPDATLFSEKARKAEDMQFGHTCSSWLTCQPLAAQARDCAFARIL
jgi:hypothetical protein